jgi:hypothetical protein
MFVCGVSNMIDVGLVHPDHFGKIESRLHNLIKIRKKERKLLNMKIGCKNKNDKEM